MENTPLLSIIIPVYNAESYLSRCFNSLINQTYKNIEIIVIDDGSTDNSGIICDDYANKDKRIKVIHKDNGGVSSARNSGLSIANGELIGFCDADDWADENMFEVLVSNLINNNVDASFCGCIEHLKDLNNYEVIHNPEKAGIVNGMEALYQCILPIKIGYYASIWNKVFKKELLIEDGLIYKFPEDILIGEDETMLFRVLPKMNKVFLDKTPLYHWYIHSDSACHKIDITRQTVSGLIGKDRNIEFGIKNNYPNYIISQMKARKYHDHYYLLVNSYLYDDTKYIEVRNLITNEKIDFNKNKNYTHKVKYKFKLIDFVMEHNLSKKIVNWLWSQTSLKYRSMFVHKGDKNEK